MYKQVYLFEITYGFNMEYYNKLINNFIETNKGEIKSGIGGLFFEHNDVSIEINKAIVEAYETCLRKTKDKMSQMSKNVLPAHFNYLLTENLIEDLRILCRNKKNKILSTLYNYIIDIILIQDSQHICLSKNHWMVSSFGQTENVFFGEFNKIAVSYQDKNPLANLIIDSYTTGSCIEGHGGIYPEASLLGEICPNVGKLYLKSYFNGVFQENIGVAYVLKCQDNDAKRKKDQTVWMIDGVETGISVSLIDDQNLWKQTFYDGICKAAKEAGVKRVVFNTRAKNPRAKKFIRWLCENKFIKKYGYDNNDDAVDYINPKLIHSDKKKKIPRYSITLCDSQDGVIESLADFGGKYYAEAWYAGGDKDAFNCCDSTQEGRPLVKGIEVKVG